MGTDAFQEAPVFNIMAPCAKHVFLDHRRDARSRRRCGRAFHIARSGRPGPVVVDVPKDVQLASSVFRGFGLLPMHGYRERLDELERVGDLGGRRRGVLQAARAPRSGRSSTPAAASSTADAAERAARLRHALRHPGRDDAHGHRRGRHDRPSCRCTCSACTARAYANYAVEDCDFLFAVGSRFDDRVAGKVKEFAPGAKIAHLDIDASEIGKVKNVDWAHVASAKRGLQQLLDVRARASRRTSRAGARTSRS